MGGNSWSWHRSKISTWFNPWMWMWQWFSRVSIPTVTLSKGTFYYIILNFLILKKTSAFVFDFSFVHQRWKLLWAFFFFRLQSWKLCLEGEGELRLMPPRRNTWEIKHPRPAPFNEIHRDLSIDNCMNCGHWLSISSMNLVPNFNIFSGFLESC